jgi:hypothetical protein
MELKEAKRNGDTRLHELEEAKRNEAERLQLCRRAVLMSKVSRSSKAASSPNIRIGVNVHVSV